MAYASRKPSNEEIFKADMVKLLAESDGFNPAPMGLADIPFAKGRSRDAAEAFIRQYEDILETGAKEKLPNSELAVRITAAFADTLGRVAYDGAAGGDAVKAAAVRKWSREFFGKALVSKDAAAQKRLDELMNRDMRDDSLTSRLNLMMHLTLLPLAWTVKKLQDSKLEREVKDRLAKLRPVNALETASKNLNRSTIALSYSLDEYNTICGCVAADKPIQIRPYGEDGKLAYAPITVERDSAELRIHLRKVESRITSLSGEYDKQLKVFKDAFGTLKDAGDLGAVSERTVLHMKSTALLQESRGRHAKTKTDSLRNLVPELKAKVGALEGAGLASPEFAKLARGGLQAQFDARLRDELREYAREAGHAVIDFDVDRAQKAIVRASDERRGFNPIEKSSINAAIGDSTKITGYLGELYADHSGLDLWLDDARERELHRLEASQKKVNALMEQAETSKFLSEVGGKDTKELLDKLKDMDAGKALSELFGKIKGLFGPKQAQTPAPA